MGGSMTIRKARLGISISARGEAACALLGLLLCGASRMHAQRIPAGPVYSPAGTIPTVNVGGTYMDAQFSRLEFAQKLLDEQNRQSEENQKYKKQMLDSGTVSPLDLQAPRNALTEFN